MATDALCAWHHFQRGPHRHDPGRGIYCPVYRRHRPAGDDIVIVDRHRHQHGPDRHDHKHYTNNHYAGHHRAGYRQYSRQSHQPGRRIHPGQEAQPDGGLHAGGLSPGRHCRRVCRGLADPAVRLASGILLRQPVVDCRGRLYLFFSA